MDVIQLTNHRDAFKTNILSVIIYNAVNISLRNQIHLTKPVALSVREKPALQASRMRLFSLQFGIILVLTISVEYCRAQSKKTLFLYVYNIEDYELCLCKNVINYCSVLC